MSGAIPYALRSRTLMGNNSAHCLPHRRSLTNLRSARAEQDVCLELWREREGITSVVDDAERMLREFKT